jgi:probable addiction module antidote protein
MKKLTKDHEEFVIEHLKKDPEFAAAYLTGYLDEEGDEHTEELFLLALRRVTQAYGFSKVAKKAKLGRESLYKALSKNGNPKITTITALLRALGFKITVEPISKGKKAS